MQGVNQTVTIDKEQNGMSIFFFLIRHGSSFYPAMYKPWNHSPRDNLRIITCDCELNICGFWTVKFII